MTNCRCDVSAFDLRLSNIVDRCVDFSRSMCRHWKIDVTPFEELRSMCRPSKIDVTMCRPSEIDVSTFED